ncbi:MAG: type II toxin-antitoxin system MqsR family toxin [Gammaproteobacteria bacterium]
MEKNTPHCKLAVVKALVGAGKVRATSTAFAGAAALGMDFTAIMAVVDGLTAADFDKSMTTYGNHRIWQDLYCPITVTGEIYLKLTVIDGVLIVSFKEAAP